VQGLPRPVFAYTYQIVDTHPGNGDGQIQRGEGVTVYLTVKNVGPGKSYETQANLRNLTGDGLYLRAGRFELPSMNPGDVREVAFTFDVLDGLTDNFAKVELSVADRDLRVVSSEKLVIPVVRNGLNINSASGKVIADQAAPVRSQPLPGAPAVAELGKGSVTERLGTFGDFTKVKLDDQRFGFVETSRVKDAGGAAGKVALKPLLTHSPPLLDVKPAALSTRGDKVKIEGVATDGDRVLDVFVFVGAHKVFYQSNRKGTDPLKLSFSFEANLDPGINVVTVVTRENEDTATRETMVVRRDGPNGQALPTPKLDEFGADWEFGGHED
jgi:carboxyl-terminal processing protease